MNANFPLCVCLGASPHFISHLFPGQCTVFREVHGVFDVGDLDLVDAHLVVHFLPIDNDVVRLDIHVNEALLVHVRNATQRVPQNPLHDGNRWAPLVDEVEKVVFEILVCEHGVFGNGIVGDTDLWTCS